MTSLAVLCGAVIFTSGLNTENPCFYYQHAYDRALTYRDRAGAMHVQAEVEEQNCTCACGLCAAHVRELVMSYEGWADMYRREWYAIPDKCREWLGADETEAR